MDGRGRTRGASAGCKHRGGIQAGRKRWKFERGADCCKRQNKARRPSSREPGQSGVRPLHEHDTSPEGGAVAQAAKECLEPTCRACERHGARAQVARHGWRNGVTTTEKHHGKQSHNNEKKTNAAPRRRGKPRQRRKEKRKSKAQRGGQAAAEAGSHAAASARQHAHTLDVVMPHCCGAKACGLAWAGAWTGA